MTSQHDKAKRWRPRFKTLAIVVTLMCCYLSLWRITEIRGVADVRDGRPYYCWSPVPFIVVEERRRFFTVYDGRWQVKGREYLKASEVYRYHFWFFGYKLSTVMSGRID